MNNGGVAGVLANIASQIPIFIDLIGWLANLIGLVLTARVLWLLVTLSKGRAGMMAHHVSPAKPVYTAIVAAALTSFGNTISTMVETFSGNQFDYSNILSYSQEAGNRFGQFSEVMVSLFMIVQALGVVGVLSGWLTLLKAGDGHTGGHPVVPKALLHMAAGGMCVYVSGTLQMLIDTGGIAHLM